MSSLLACGCMSRKVVLYFHRVQVVCFRFAHCPPDGLHTTLDRSVGSGEVWRRCSVLFGKSAKHPTGMMRTVVAQDAPRAAVFTEQLDNRVTAVALSC